MSTHDENCQRSGTILPKPNFIAHNGDTICVDSCIADIIQHLWEHGVYTVGSCCGHGLSRPSVVIENHCDTSLALELLGDRWDVLQWQLVNVRTRQEIERRTVLRSEETDR